MGWATIDSSNTNNPLGVARDQDPSGRIDTVHADAVNAVAEMFQAPRGPCNQVMEVKNSGLWTTFKLNGFCDHRGPIVLMRPSPPH